MFGEFRVDYLMCCADSGYLFEGHLTVDQEPPRPQWMVQSDLLNTFIEAESSGTPENAASVLQQLMSSLDDVIPLVIL